MSKFTQREAKFLVDHLQEVWDSIGHDMFLNDKGKYDESIVIPKSQVVEVCIDRMEVAGASIFQRIVIAKFWECPNDHVEKRAIINKAFPYAEYGA